MFKSVLVFVVLALCLAGCARREDSLPARDEATPVILLVIEGLRLDYATPELMPALAELGAGGVVFENHHSIFPTLTQVNAASIVTGAGPATHGLLGDQLLYPELSDSAMDAESAEHLDQIEQATGGRALSALTVGELLDGEGRDLLVATSGTSGLAWVLSYGAEPRPGRSRVLSPGLIQPEGLKAELVEAFGPLPGDASPAGERDRWATDVFLRYAFAEARPALSILWLTGPDAAQHLTGIGSRETLEAVRAADTALGRVISAIRERGLTRQTHLLVTADHGFIRQNDSNPLSDSLVRAGLKSEASSTDVRTVGNEIYIEGRDPEKIRVMVQWLARQASTGGLLTRSAVAGKPAGSVEGTLSYETIHREEVRAGDIMVVPNWSEGPADSAYPGIAAAPGRAGHGGASPYELQIPLVASGPAFQSGTRVGMPSSHADLAPTMLQLLGIPAPESIEGRVLNEAMIAGEADEPAEEMTRSYRARLDLGGGAERIIELQELGVGGRSYLHRIRGLYRAGEGSRATPGTPSAPPQSGLAE